MGIAFTDSTITLVPVLISKAVMVVTRSLAAAVRAIEIAIQGIRNTLGDSAVAAAVVLLGAVAQDHEAVLELLLLRSTHDVRTYFRRTGR